VNEEENPTNTMKARTRGALSLGPSGNLQGGHKFLVLNTGKTISRRQWTEIPMSDTVITRVNKLGHSQPEDFVFTIRGLQVLPSGVENPL